MGMKPTIMFVNARNVEVMPLYVTIVRSAASLPKKVPMLESVLGGGYAGGVLLSRCAPGGRARGAVPLRQGGTAARRGQSAEPRQHHRQSAGAFLRGPRRTPGGGWPRAAAPIPIDW